jgi:predicted ester cyclase
VFEGIFKMFPDCKMEIGHTYTLGDWVCAECIESGTMKGPIKHSGGEVPPTGKAYKISNILVCRIEGGKIAEIRSFFDAVDLTTQLGLKA